MIHRVIFGFSKDLYGEHVQNETSTLANTDSTSVCWPRLVRSTKWTIQQQETRDLRIGYFGSSTGGAAALGGNIGISTRSRCDRFQWWTTRPGWRRVPKVQAPTLLIVGGNDDIVIELNENGARSDALRSEAG